MEGDKVGREEGGRKNMTDTMEWDWVIIYLLSLIIAVPLSEMAGAATGHLQVPLTLSKP